MGVIIGRKPPPTFLEMTSATETENTDEEDEDETEMEVSIKLLKFFHVL